MLRAGVGTSTEGDSRRAAREAAEAALAGCGPGGVDAALLFATPAHSAGIAGLLDEAVAVLGTSAVVGATAHGVLGGGGEVEGGRAVSLLAFSGIEAGVALIPEIAGDERGACAELGARLGGAPEARDLAILLPDPAALRPDALLGAAREQLGPAQLVGAGAADPVSEQPLQWCGRSALRGGLAALLLRPERPARIGVTQACRPATPLLEVTRAQGHWILELDGRPALEVYREVARGPLAEDLRRAAAFLLVALPRDPDAPLEPGGYLVRNVAGFAPEENAFAIPEPVAAGDRIALAQREPQSALEDLKAMTAALGDAAPACGVYLDCCARGAAFFGVPGLEAAYLESAFGPAPVAGMFGSCEIGPIAGRAELLTYTGVLALLDG